jgi:histidine triad (HIT) family protein
MNGKRSTNNRAGMDNGNTLGRVPVARAFCDNGRTSSHWRCATMSLYGVYDGNNVFAKIIRGEAPCHKVFEDEHTLAFLDLFPQARGHTLVIPKRAQARNLLELDADNLTCLFLATQRIARAIVAAIQPDGVQIFQFNGGQGGQSVYHVHVHVVPRWPGQPLGLHAQQRGDDTALAQLAAIIAAKVN